MPSTETPAIWPMDNEVILLIVRADSMVTISVVVAKSLFPDNGAGFCHRHQNRDLEQSCHFSPVSIVPLVAAGKAIRSPQGLGAPWGLGAASCPPRWQGRAQQPGPSHSPSPEQGSQRAPGRPQPWASGTSLGMGWAEVRP